MIGLDRDEGDDEVNDEVRKREVSPAPGRMRLEELEEGPPSRERADSCGGAVDGLRGGIWERSNSVWF